MERDKQVLLNVNMKRFRNTADKYILIELTDITRHLMKYERFTYKVKYNGRYENEYIERCIFNEAEIYFLWKSYGEEYNARLYVNEHTLKMFVNWLLEKCEDKTLEENKPELLIRKKGK